MRYNGVRQFALKETWLTDSLFDNEILPTNYTIFRKDCSSHGGGVLIAVNNSISCTQVTSPDGLEAISIQLNLSNLITVWVIYVAPSSTAASEYNNLLDFLREISKMVVIIKF